MSLIRIKRVYEEATEEDGFRILVDRLWPRGLSKKKARVDLWLKDIAPSDELRKWFSHDPKKWEAFRRKYELELKGKRDLLDRIRQAEKEHKVLTLLYSSKEKEHNNAIALSIILKAT
jgi:uncharacterized protein YeaO (DUF488 family)